MAYTEQRSYRGRAGTLFLDVDGAEVIINPAGGFVARLLAPGADVARDADGRGRSSSAMGCW